MEEISDLTYKIIGFAEIKNFSMDDCVDWAVEMVELGYEQPAILILAGITKPTDYFEVKPYLLEAFTELKLEQKNGAEAVLYCAYYYIRRIAEGASALLHLGYLYKLYLNCDRLQELGDFNLLYWAWGDLDYGNAEQHYWPGADKTNIEEIIVGVAKKWLMDNEKDFLPGRLFISQVR